MAEKVNEIVEEMKGLSSEVVKSIAEKLRGLGEEADGMFWKDIALRGSCEPKWKISWQW